MVDKYKVDKLAVITRKGTPYQPKSVNLHLEVLGRMPRVAQKWKLIREVPEIALLKERKSDFDFLDFDEAEEFLAGVAEHVPEWHPYMVLAIRTGLRVGEMVALRWREDMIKRLAPPIPTEGAKPDGRAAKSRHKHSTRKAKQPKSAA